MVTNDLRWFANLGKEDAHNYLTVLVILVATPAVNAAVLLSPTLPA